MPKMNFFSRRIFNGGSCTAARDSKAKFTSLAHLLTEEFLKGCYRQLNRQAAAGINQVGYASYGENLD
jgi:hypothetical protein